MAFWSERHVMQLDKRVLKLARQLWLIVCWPSKDFKQEILNVYFLSSEHGLPLSVVAALMVSEFRLIARKGKTRTLLILHHRSLCRLRQTSDNSLNIYVSSPVCVFGCSWKG